MGADPLRHAVHWADGRLRAFEATLVQAKLDGVTRLETGETPWAITVGSSSNPYPLKRVRFTIGYAN